MSTLFIYGLLAHIVADWFLQNNWQATYKVSLKHPASWVHSGLHLVCLLFVFAPLVAMAVAASHLLIDTRKPLGLWRRLVRQTTDASNPVFVPFAMWQDQAAHILIIGLAAIYQTGAFP